MRPALSHYAPISELAPDRFIAMHKSHGTPTLLESFSYQGMTLPKRKQLAQNLYHLTECKHPSLLVYHTVINDRERASYHLAAEASALRPLGTELKSRADCRIFYTSEDIEMFFIDLVGAINWVFSHHMQKEAIRLLCHSLSVENIYLQGDGHAKLALRPYYGRKIVHPNIEQQPLDLYEDQSDKTVVFLLGQIVLRLILTADDFTEFTKGRAYLLSLHCRKRFKPQLVDLIERMTRTVVHERMPLQTLLDQYCGAENTRLAEVARGITRTKELQLTDLMVSAALDSYRELQLYTPFQHFCTDALGRTALMVAIEAKSYTSAHYLMHESGFIFREPGVDYGDLDYVPTEKELEEITIAKAAEKEAAEIAERLAAEKKTKGKKKKVSRPPTASETETKPTSRGGSRSGKQANTGKQSEQPARKTSTQLLEELEAKKAARPLPYKGVRGTFSSLRLAAEQKYSLFRDAVFYERHLLQQEGITELMMGVLGADYQIFQQYKQQTQKQDNKGYTACMYAVKAGWLPIVGRLIEAEKNIKNADGETAGVLALQEGHQEIVDFLTRYESILDEDNNTLLHLSVLNNQPENLKKYIHLASQFNSKGKTALMLAAERGYDACVEELLCEAGATTSEEDPALSGWKDVTALMLASVHGHTQCVALLEKDEAERRDSAGNHTALMAASIANKASIIPLLINREGGLQNSKGHTALMLAVNLECVEAVEALVSVEGKAINTAGNTALMEAVLAGKSAMVGYLVKHEANVLRKDTKFALQLAIEQGSQEIARELLSYEEELLLATGFTDLMRAAFFGDLAACRQHIKQAGKRTNSGVTALMLAARTGHIDVVRLLAEQEARLFDGSAVTAGSIAYRSGHEEIYSFLAPREIVADENNSTLLHKAAESESLDVVKKYNHMVGRLTTQNKTACQLARQAKRDDITAYLEKKGDVVDSDQCTLLHLAAIKNSVEDAEKLLHMAGCYNKAGKTALMEAAERDNIDIVKLLAPLETHIRATKGFTVGGYTFKSPTALMLAARAGSAQSCEELIEFESRLTISETGLTALMAAALQDKVECVNLLRDRECRIAEKTGKTALMLAAKGGKVGSLKALAEREHGMTDQDGKTAATLAKQAKKSDCVTALKAYEKPETKQHARTDAEKPADAEGSKQPESEIPES